MKKTEAKKAELIVEMLRAVRGKRTQMQLSKRIGFRFNQIHRWESLKTEITWRDFLRIADACQVPYAEAFKNLTHYKGDVDDVPSLLRFLMGSRSMKDMAEELGLSRFALSRWLNDHAEPHLLDILNMLEAYTLYFPEAVQALTGGKKLASLDLEISRRDSHRRIAMEKPWILALIACLDTDAYLMGKTHVPGVIASALGIDEATERETLDELHALGIITLKKGKWAVNSNRKLLIDPTIGREIGYYWHSEIAQCTRYFQGTDASFGSFIVFSCSKEALKDIKQRYVQFYNEAIAIIDGDKGSGVEVGVLNYHQMRLADIQAAKKANAKV